MMNKSLIPLASIGLWLMSQLTKYWAHIVVFVLHGLSNFYMVIHTDAHFCSLKAFFE